MTYIYLFMTSAGGLVFIHFFVAARGVSRRLFASQRKWKLERAFGTINDHSSTIRIILHEHNTCQGIFALSQQKSIVF